MIDLRSDTVTLPSAEMLDTIRTAKVGDSGRWDTHRKGGDPTVNELEAYAAQLVGKEDAVFCVSGTMGNLTALLTHCKPGDWVLVDETQHLYHKEKGAFLPFLGQLQETMYKSTEDGLPDLDDIKEKLATGKYKLLCLENSNNNRGGTCIPVSLMKAIYEAAHSCGVQVHLDGARVFNAAYYLGVDVKEITQYVDSVMFCVSKGLGAPVGSLICGTADFIYQLRQVNRYLGGSMRQAGVIAAPALYALQHNIPDLAEDNQKARSLCDALKELKQIKVPDSVETNIVMLETAPGRSEELQNRLKEHGVLSGAVDECRVRLVFHRDIPKEEVADVIEILRKIDLEMAG